ncbi:MAG: hypothetical protein ACI97A_000336 [Planctomycetota bacterium]|jgi:hypothetical protein
MDELFRKNVKFFLAGTLSKNETLKFLDQVKEFEACRVYLEEQVRLSSASHQPHMAAPNRLPGHGCSSATPRRSSVSSSPIDSPHLGAILRPRRGIGAKKTLMFGCLLLAVLYALRPALTEDDKPELTATDVVVAEALTDGAPISTSPKGSYQSRPMIISAFFPSGNESARLVFLSSGVSILDWSFKQGDWGVQFDTTKVPSTTGELPALEVVLPFPDKTTLPLEKGKRYFYFLELPNGRQSAPQSIDIR